MGKLQPNFSWQKYEGAPEDQKEQFQYQLQQQHTQVSNTTNATIDDLSYFTAERPTSWAWVDGNQIYKRTYKTVAWTAGGTVNTIPLGFETGVQGFITVIHIEGFIQDGHLFSSTTDPLPYLDVTTASNSIQIQRVGQNIILTSGGRNYSTYSGYVTIYYTKS